ncbi:TSUP family transporter [Corynebacterium camporealensis]
MMTAVAIMLTVAFGSSLQRISGMGLGLVGGPILTLLLGPVQGIMVINVLACLNAALTTYTVREWVDWKKFALISSVMVIGSIPAAVLVSRVESSTLLIIVGASLLIALSIVVFGNRFVPRTEGKTPAVVAGVIGGFTNTLAGIAGPVITVYAQAARWPQQMYAATLQPIFMVGGAVSFIVKGLAGAGGGFSTDWLIWPAGIAGMVIGVTLGNLLAGKVSRILAHRLSLIVAFGGAASALIRGIVS